MLLGIYGEILRYPPGVGRGHRPFADFRYRLPTATYLPYQLLYPTTATLPHTIGGDTLQFFTALWGALWYVGGDGWRDGVCIDYASKLPNIHDLLNKMKVMLQ